MAEEEQRIRDFKFDRILNSGNLFLNYNLLSSSLTLSDTGRKSLNMLGTINGQQAILIAEKTFFNVTDLSTFTNSSVGLHEITLLERNDIYHWFLASQFQDADKSAGVKLTLIYP